MPIAVVCTSCKAKLNAPDKLAGKKVKCPKCQKPVLVAAPAVDDDETEEFNEPAPAAKPTAAAKPKPGPRPQPTTAKAGAPKPKAATPKPAAKDDDDDDDDDKPRKKPKKKKSALPLILIGGGVVLFGGVALVVLLILFLIPWGSDPIKQTFASQPQPTKSAQPTITWLPHDDPEFFFKAAFPNTPPTQSDPLAQSSNPAMREALGKLMQGGKGRYLTAVDGNREYQLIVFGLPVAGVPGRAFLGQFAGILGQMNKGYKIEPLADLESAGHPAKDFLLNLGDKVKLVRVVIAPGYVYMVAVEGGSDLTPEDAMAKEYFGRFGSTLKPEGGAGNLVPPGLDP